METLEELKGKYKKTKDVLTYWFKIRRTTNLKDSQGNVVCIDDELIDPTGRKCWLLCDDELYIRYDYWLSPKGKPDIKDVKDLSKFTITKGIQYINNKLKLIYE